MWVGGSTVVAVALMTNFAWAQLVPPVPDVVPDVTNAAQDATNTAQDAVKDAQDTAQDAVKDTQDTAQDAAKNAQDTAKDVTKDATKAAQDATKDAQNTTRDVTKKAREAGRDARDTARDTSDDVRDVTRDATRSAREAGRDARDTARDATDDVRDATRDTTRDARDTVRDATRDRDSIDARARVRTQGSATVGGRGNYRGADLGIWFDRSSRDSLIIADVAADAALSSIGFREGDRIVSVAGQNVVTEADFMRYLFSNNVRGRTNVIVLRDGQQQTLYVDPSVLDQRMTTIQVEPLEVFGIIPDDRYDDRVVVWRVIPRSPAFYAGIRAGDIITSFANRPISNLRAFVQLALQTRAGSIPLQVTRNGRTRMIEADYPDVQVSDRRTTFRQNLDSDVNVRSNIDADARLRDTGRTDADVRADAEADLDVPVIETQPRTRGNVYDYDRPATRRGLFRRGR
jgi:vacuolar-type H+-ATPase subunit H